MDDPANWFPDFDVEDELPCFDDLYWLPPIDFLPWLFCPDFDIGDELAFLNDPNWLLDSPPDCFWGDVGDDAGAEGIGVLELFPSQSTAISLLNFGDETVVISTILRSRLLLRRSLDAVLIYRWTYEFYFLDQCTFPHLVF